MKKNIKVLLSKLGLDVHSRGVLTVARQLRDAGMEVNNIGNSTTQQIIKATIQEDADVVGVSSLGGAHLKLGKDLIDEAVKENIKENKVFIIGGAISQEDIIKLKEMGFDDIFTSGATKEEIVSSIESITSSKSG